MSVIGSKKCPACNRRFLGAGLYCAPRCRSRQRQREALAMRLDLIESAVALARSALDEVEKQAAKLGRYRRVK